MARSRVLNLANLQQFAAIQVLSDPGYIGGPKLIPSCAEITINWVLGSGNIAHNVLTGRYTGVFQGSQAQADSILAALIAGASWSALATFLAPTTGISSVSIRDLAIADQPIITSIGAPGIGTSTGTELPNEVAAVLTERTAFTGPSNRGRIYVPGWATNALGTGNVMAAGAVTALTNWGLIISGALSGSGYTLSIGHVARAAYLGSTGTQHPARPAGSVPVTSIEVRDNHWDSQRRRGLR